MKMSEGGSIADHLNEFNTVTNKLIVFMENKRESYFSESEKKRRMKG
jgi:hypothetical protein